jgi:hypothetical protein
MIPFHCARFEVSTRGASTEKLLSEILFPWIAQLML